MWTKKHKIFFAALLQAHLPSLTKKELKSNGFSGSDIKEIDKLAQSFNTGETIADTKKANCMLALKNLTSNQLKSNADFIHFCESFARINAYALRYLSDNGLYKDADQRTPIFYIAVKGTKADAVQLLSAGAQYKVKDVHGYTPLTLAAINNNTGAMEAFLEAGADANSQDKEGATALHFAAQLGFANLFPLLIKHGAVVDHQSKNGLTPFGLAVTAGQYECARILAKEFKCSVDYLGKDEETLMQVACREFHHTMNDKKLHEAEKIYKRIAFLLNIGANVNRVYILKPMNTKYNYFAEAVLSRLHKNTLQELDYKLTELFANYHFQFTQHCIDDVALLDLIFHHRNVRLTQSCKLAPEGARAVIKVVDNNSEKAGYLFSSRSLNQEEHEVIAEWLQPLFNEIFMCINDELHQLIFDEEEIPAPMIAVAAVNADANIEKNEDKNDDKKQTFIKIILDLIADFFTKYKKYGAFNIPTWCNELTAEKLKLKSLNALDELRIRIAQWGEKTLRQLEAKQFIDAEKAVPAVKPLISDREPSSVAIYESTLKYSRKLMLDISETCCLLIPFNDKGEIGLDVISDAKHISASDHSKFERVLKQPSICRSANQPGIRFLIDSNYFCNVRINQINKRKLLVAEVKIADSPNRIGLYRLTQQGSGKMVLALGPYVEKGFHDGRYQGHVFQAHSLNLGEAFIREVERRIATNDTPSLRAAAASNFMLWQPNEGATREPERALHMTEETASTNTKSLWYSSSL